MTPHAVPLPSALRPLPSELRPRVIGIDPGTVSIDLCGLDGGALFLDRSLPTAEALADPAAFVAVLEEARPVDLIVGPSGYGLPLVRAGEATEEQLRLAYLAAEGDAGGIGGLRRLARALARSALPIVFTPGVIHLTSVPDHRKVNRVDMGTADKVCSAALAIYDQARRARCSTRDVSFILIELGGAFTSAMAVEGGRIVDGIGGTSGPIGLRAAGALDGEVAFLAGSVSKSMLFRGGAAMIAGDEALLERVGQARRTHTDPLRAMPEPARIAWKAYAEGAIKAVAALLVSVPEPREILLSGRMASAVHSELRTAFDEIAPTRVVEGIATVAKQAAQGAALIADGLAGGEHRDLVDTLGIREARGTVLDHLYVIDREDAWRKLTGTTSDV
jgi:predicted butyrate kinase (DUF1464 family)